MLLAISQLIALIVMVASLVFSGAVTTSNSADVQSSLGDLMNQTQSLSAQSLQRDVKPAVIYKTLSALSANLASIERGLVLNEIEIMQMRVIPVKPNKEHTDASGHLEAEDIRKTLSCKGASDIWKMYFMGQDRYFLICQIDAPGKKWDKKWGWQIIYKVGNEWHEITSYIKAKGVYKLIVDWLVANGCKHVSKFLD
jgi:hypothetical protein